MPRNYYDVEYDRGPGWGEQFGQGLLSGLEELVTHKIGQVRERQQSKRTEESYKGLGAPSNVARGLSMASPEVQKLYLESGAAADWPRLRREEEQRMQQERHVSPVRRNMRQLQQPQQAPTPTQQFVSPTEAQSVRGRLAQALNPTGDQRQEELLNKLRSPEQRRQALQEHGLPIPEQQPQMRQQEPEYETGAMTPVSAAPQMRARAPQPEEQPTQQAQQRQTPERPLPIDQAIAQKAQQDEQQEIVPFAKNQPLKSMSAKEVSAIQKETLPDYQKIKNDYDFFKFATPRMNKIEKLVKQGGLPLSGLYKVFKKIEEHFTPEIGAKIGAGLGGTLGAATGGLTGAAAGLATGGTASIPGAILGAVKGGAAGSAIGGAAGAGLSFLSPMLLQMQRVTSPNTEEFEKEEATFLRGINDVFGGRITNNEMEAYMKMWPTLFNTDAGKLAIIKNFRTYGKAADVKFRVANQIMRENGGKRPWDFSEQVDLRAQPEIDNLADIFRSDFAAAIA